jgi:excinuclease ABC subunit A
MYETDEKIELDKNKKHSIDIVVDRLVMDRANIRKRLTDSIETASNLSGGIIKILIPASAGEENAPGEEDEMTFSQNYACKTHGVSIGELTPRMFSFNAPAGACEVCQGLGESFVVSPEKIMPDKSLSLFTGAVIVNGFKSIEPGSYSGNFFNLLGKYYGFDIHTPIKDYTPEALDVLLFGNIKNMNIHHRNTGEPRYEGLIPSIKRRFDTCTNAEQREYYEDYMENVPCPVCGGMRLKKESLSVTVGGLNIMELCRLPISRAMEFFKNLKLTQTEQVISKEIIK